MSRINLSDNLMDIVMKMSDGNPGAIHAIMQILEEHESIDPQAALGGLGSLMILDDWEIYGADIYVMFNDVCNGDVRKMLMLERAVQLGFFSQDKFELLAKDHTGTYGIDDSEWDDLDSKVCSRLDKFMRKQETE